VAGRLFSTHSNYVFEHHPDERQRLHYQFELLREDFGLWFDEALRLGALSTDRDDATWSVVDVGCGEGQYTREIVRRYPNARATGTDVDASSIAAANAATDGPNPTFTVHDAREPLPADLTPDIAVAWMVLMYLPDKRAVLANLAAALKPGGVLLVGYVPDEPVALDHPAARAIFDAGRDMLARIGMSGLEVTVPALLGEVGFTDVGTVTLRYPLGGATAYGRRWYAHALASTNAARGALVDVFKAMDGAEYDRLFTELTRAPVLDVSGETRFLVTLARRPAG
jgi:SAM-dependent methyltransferase